MFGASHIKELFEAGRFEEAADALSDSSEPIEFILLKFYSGRAEGKTGLKRFLQLKIDRLSDSKDAQQRDVFVLLLLELHLSELEETQKFGGNELTGGCIDTRAHLHAFVDSAVVRESLRQNFPAVVHMTRQHGDNETLLHLANALQEYGVVVESYVRLERFDDALDVLRRHGDPTLLYAYVPKLIGELPEGVAELMRERRLQLEIGHLMNVINRQPEASDANATRKHSEFIAFVIRLIDELIKPTPGQFLLLRPDRDVFDAAVKLYLDYRPERLLGFLKAIGKRRRRLPYDFEAVLHACLDRELDECCAFLYCIDRRYRSAVVAALKVNVDLARACALEMAEFANDVTIDLDDFDFDDVDGPAKPNEEDQRNVWKLILRHIVENKSIVPSSSSSIEAGSSDCVDLCMALVEESKHVLKVSDVIANYTSFSRIEPFKDVILTELRRRNSAMQENKMKIAETIDVIHELKRKQRAKRLSKIVVKLGDNCNICSRALSNDRFYAFICRHLVHFNCLKAAALEKMSEEERRCYHNLVEKEKSLAQKHRQSVVDLKSRNNDVSKQLNDVNAKLNRLLTKSCPICDNISSIGVPIISDERHKIEQNRYNILIPDSSTLNH